MANPDIQFQPVRLSLEGFELDEVEARLTFRGRPLALAPRPFGVLCALARAPGMLVRKDDLVDAVWGHRFVTESALKSAISDLRAVLQDDPKQPRWIETVPRRGYRFIGAAQAAAAAPAAAKTAAPSPRPQPMPLIGRSDALARLRAAWRSAQGGQSRILWVAGEPGIGKTTLIQRFLAETGDAPCAVGNCVQQHGTGEPCLPVLEALGALCRRDSGLVELMRAVAPTWLLELPWLTGAGEREALRRGLSDARQPRMLRELGELLDHYTGKQPLLLVTEDLQWSDEATVRLMDYIARRRGSARVLWLASFRLADIAAADHPLAVVRRELRLHGQAEEIVLEGFSECEVARYLARDLPAFAADEAFVRALHQATDGLPLFVASVVRDLAARGLPAPGAPSAATHRLATAAMSESLGGIVSLYREVLCQRTAPLAGAGSHHQADASREHERGFTQRREGAKPAHATPLFALAA